MPDSLGRAPRLAKAARPPVLPERFLAPPGLEWGEFVTSDRARLRWAYLPAVTPRAECVLVTGFMEFVEKQFETMRDLAARGISVRCLDWRGQGRSSRPRRWPNRPRARNFARDAADLAEFAAAVPGGRRPSVLIGHSMGGAIALLCLRARPELFDVAVLSAPMLGLRIGRLPPASLRCITGPMRIAGLGSRLIPGARRWPPQRVPSPATSRVSSDPERCRLHHDWFAADPELRLDGPTFGWLDAALSLTGRIGKAEFLAAIKTPILLGSAEREAIVSSAAHRRAARLLPDCTLVPIVGSKHEPFLEQDTIRNDWLDRVERFIAERCGAPASGDRASATRGRG